MLYFTVPMWYKLDILHVLGVCTRYTCRIGCISATVDLVLQRGHWSWSADAVECRLSRFGGRGGFFSPTLISRSRGDVSMQSCEPSRSCWPWELRLLFVNPSSFYDIRCSCSLWVFFPHVKPWVGGYRDTACRYLLMCGFPISTSPFL